MRAKMKFALRVLAIMAPLAFNLVSPANGLARPCSILSTQT